MRYLTFAILLALGATSFAAELPGGASVKQNSGAANTKGVWWNNCRWWFQTADGRTLMWTGRNWEAAPSVAGGASAAANSLTSRIDRPAYVPQVRTSYPDSYTGEFEMNGIPWYRDGRDPFSD